MHQGTSQKNGEGDVASPENATSETPRPLQSITNFVGDGYRDSLTFYPDPPANHACSSREGKSISGVLMEFEACTEFHAIKEPPVCSDSVLCLLTMHQYCES